jgi:hypothetical protein
MARLHSVAAASRWISIDSDLVARLSGSRPPSRTTIIRSVECVLIPRSAAMAWNCTLQKGKAESIIVSSVITLELSGVSWSLQSFL